MRDHLRSLLAHAAWADAEFYAAWAESPCREHEELRRRAAHVRDVQRAFTAMIGGGQPVWPSPDLPGHDQLKADARAAYAGLAALLDDLADDRLTQPTTHLPWFGEPAFHITGADGFVQVALHTQHHRGQLMTRLRDHGGTPRNVDYVIWLRKGRPAANWS